MSETVIQATLPGMEAPTDISLLDEEALDVLKIAMTLLAQTVNKIDDTFKVLDDLQRKIKSVPEELINQLKAQAFDAIDSLFESFDLNIGI